VCKPLRRHENEVELRLVGAGLNEVTQLARQIFHIDRIIKIISVTTDHWTSNEDETYSCLTMHYCANGELKEYVLHIAVHKEACTQEMMLSRRLMKSVWISRLFHEGGAIETATSAWTQ
jgi:hypothetical protein